PIVEEVVDKDNNSINEIKFLKEIITSVRNLRGEMNLSPALKVPLIIEESPDADSKFKSFMPYIQSLAKISQISFTSCLSSNHNAPIAVVAGVRFMLQVEVDVAMERVRLNKEIDKYLKELEKINIKLHNPVFLEKAPKDLVARDTSRVKELTKVVETLKLQLLAIGSS
ncbi:MAG: valine--tRNA ligase, partial [Burkholderiales bacterium]|nr:valine--tRNA ligase [Burkholderiales bacterium]